MSQLSQTKSEMNMLRIFLSALLIVSLFSCKPEGSAESWDLSSPDGKLSLQLHLQSGELFYSLAYAGEALILPSKLGFSFKKTADLHSDLQRDPSAEITTNSVDMTWTPVWGERNQVRDRHNELRLPLKSGKDSGLRMVAVFRVFDDGLGFRYEIPAQDGVDSLFMTDEMTEFRFAQDFLSWWIPDDHDSYEHWYTESVLSDVEGVNTPVTMKTASGVHLSVHEAALTDYAGMTLRRISGSAHDFKAALVPWPDGILVKSAAPMKSPWRTITVSPDAGGLLLSDLILNLNEPNVLEDTDWIKPQKYVGIWWGMHVRKYSWEEGPIHGATTENTKAYMDFASKHDIGGVLVEGWNYGWHDWSTMDFTQPYPDFDLFDITEFGRERGVSLVGHHETGANVPSYERQMDDAFELYSRAGIKAIKTGYVGKIPGGVLHHGQQMVRHYRKVVQKAAEHRIMLDVHEPIKPTGIRRTYPNMMTREGACGQEYNAWSVGNAPEHELILPFTRLLAGPMDYTPGVFDILFEEYSPDYRVWTTLGKQLSFYVLLFSPLQMAADNFENYVDHPAFKFIDDVPTVWDETRVLDAVVGDKLVMVRRSGEEWFLGAATDEQARLVHADLSFLDAGRDYYAEVYTDAPQTGLYEDPASYEIFRMKLSSSQSLDIALSTGGGTAVRFFPAEDQDLSEDITVKDFNTRSAEKMKAYSSYRIYERPDLGRR